VQLSIIIPSYNEAERLPHTLSLLEAYFHGGLKRDGVRLREIIVVDDGSADGTAAEERPVPVPDFMATVCRALGIDYNKQNHAPNGRPIRIVDRPANPITQLF